MSTSLTKSLVQKILERPLGHAWTLQGLGMLRLYLDDERRMHIWDSRYRVHNVSQMHTHPWDFHSIIVAGSLHNQRFAPWVDRAYEAGHGPLEFNQQTIFCGIGGGLEGEPSKVLLEALPVEEYEEGQSYSELAHEIHLSFPEQSTITIVKRKVVDDPDHAFVFWESGDWVSAEPRAATDEEVLDITSMALFRHF